MTREEIIDSIWGDAVRRNINIVRDDVVEMVDFVLRKHCPEPQRLDEAAEEYCKKMNYLNEVRDRQEDGTLYYSLETDTAIDAFKAGAKWMAEQGEEAEVGYWKQTGLSIRLDKALERLGYKEGDKVIVQIRKA